MNNNTNTSDVVCCGTTMDDAGTEIHYVRVHGFPVFIDQVYACLACGAVRRVDISDPCEREQIAGHMADPKVIAPLCCLDTMTEMDPDITLHPLAVCRVFLCEHCLQHKSFPVTDTVKRDQIISACLMEVDE